MRKSFLLGSLLALTLTTSAFAMDAGDKGALATIATIDKNEILVSVLAENKKVDSDVVDFAKMMIAQHGSNLTQIMEMDAQLKAGPLSGGESDKLAAQGKAEFMKLGGLEGKDFEHAYVDAMVNGHQAALNLIDTKLLKGAKSEEVKKFLTDTRAAVVTHLDHAKKLQEDMKS